MPWMPGATKRQIDWANNLSRSGVEPTAVVLHLTASEAESQYNYFSSHRVACSHFHVARDGAIEQYAGTGARSAADSSSKRTISVETQGADAGGQWTAAQLESLAKIVAWCHKEHGIPLRKMSSSALSEKGVGWHRLGIDGNFPAGELGGRLQRGGGEKWSSARGKVCPGDARIRQVDQIITRAQQLAGGSSSGGGGAGGGASKAPTGPVPAPSKPSGLTVDGKWGTSTTLRLQQVLGAPIKDGKISRQASKHKGSNPGLTAGWEWDGRAGDGGSQTIALMQKRLGVTADGKVGPNTFKALQRHLGTPQDGVVSYPSTMVRALQTRLNQGKF